MFLWLVGALWALQLLASLLLLEKEFFFVKERTRFPLLFDQTSEKEDEFFLFCLTKLFRENTYPDENKSSQVLSGASGANTGHFASFFYYTRYNIIAIVIIIVIIIICITIIRISTFFTLL